MSQRLAVTLLGLGAILTVAAPVLLADRYHGEWEDDDYAYDRARRAVDRQESLPMPELLEKVRQQLPGEVVGIDFEGEHGRWIYELKIVDERGHLLEVYVDAKTGEVLSVEDD